MDYCNLHVHSEHSLLDGAAKISALAESAAKMGQKYLSLTDHGSMSGAVLHKKSCDKNGIVPLYGVELFMIEHFDRLSDSKLKQPNMHLTAIAKDKTGFELLMKGLGYANQYGLGKSGKFRRAFLPYRYPLENNWKDHIVILSGCASSPFYKLSDADGLELFKEYASNFGKDFYGEIMPLHDWDQQKDNNDLCYEMSKITKSKLVVTNDIHYCKEEDWKLHEIIIAMSDYGMTWNNPNRWKFSTHSNYFRTSLDMAKSLQKMGMHDSQIKPALENTLEVAEKCAFKLEKCELDLPNPLDEGIDESEYFFRQCRNGMNDRDLAHKGGYWHRLEKEIEVLESKGFIRYMLIVADLIQWAKSSGIFVGPARGSSAGSLVSYVLKITDIDPIEHGLQFERFVAPDRIDLPDIDIDIEDRSRSVVEKYLREKYGSENVGHLSTFQKLLGRSALRDVGRLFEIPRNEIDLAAKVIIKRMEGEPRAHNTIEDTIEESKEFREFSDKYPEVVNNASKLEGQIRGMGVHAAGYVLSRNKLNESNRCYIVEGNSGIKAVNWDKEDLEFFGLVKIDLLGLATHSVISSCLELIKKNHNKDLKMSTVPFDDPKVYEAIGRGETATMFTLSATGTAAYCKKMKPVSLAEIADAVALWRPGPIVAGMCEDYVKVKFGEKEAEYFCPEYKEIVEATRGQLIYQEQVTDLLMKLAGFSYTDADKVRKVVGKKLGVEALNKYQQQFVDGCKAKGTMKPEQAEYFWKSLSGFASYAFNKAHAVSYAVVAYWTAWLKVNYPAEWLCAYLNYGSTERENSDGETNLDIALVEAQRLGVSILAPSVSDSLEDWSVADGKALRAGLKEIRNIGPAAKEELARARSSYPNGFSSVEQFIGIVNKRQLNSRCIKSLLAVGAFDDMPDVEIHKSKHELKGTPEERAEYLNYDESRLFNKSVILRDMSEALGIELDESQFTDALAGRLPQLKVPAIDELKIKGLKELRKFTQECSKCDLRKTCTKPVPIELGKCNMMIVAEAPGFNEDKRNRPLVGRSGELLFECLGEYGLDRDLFYIDNVVHCRPPENSRPSPKTIDVCDHLDKAIEAIKPKVILALGNSALYKFIGKEKGILSYAGSTQWHPQYKCWITYGVHPSYALRDDDGADSRLATFRKGTDEFKRLVFNLLGASE